MCNTIVEILLVGNERPAGLKEEVYSNSCARQVLC